MLVTIALLCVDFGRFAHSYIAVTNAARAGAGYASIHPVTAASKPAWDAAIRQTVQDELTANGWFDAAQLTVPPSLSVDEGNGYHRVTVEVSYPFQTLINWPFLPGYNDPLDLRHTVVMRRIR
jgi:Flp pilus assembly protein TadG